MINPGLFTSATPEWATPQDLFDRLDAVHHFTLDVCATHENAKCQRYFTREQDGLAQDWDGRAWMNPPYGKEIGLWVDKALRASRTTARFVVCLLPARTDTRWFHELCLPYGRVEFIRGRLKFGGSKNSAPFPSMIVTFGGDKP